MAPAGRKEEDDNWPFEVGQANSTSYHPIHLAIPRIHLNRSKPWLLVLAAHPAPFVVPRTPSPSSLSMIMVILKLPRPSQLSLRQTLIKTMLHHVEPLSLLESDLDDSISIITTITIIMS